MLAPALGFSQTAGAPADGNLALRWSDPGGLSPTTASEFEAHLSERLGRPAFGAQGDAQHTLEVRWEGSPEQCRVDLGLYLGGQVEGTRRLESPIGDCRSLGPALLTVAALLIESRAAETVEPERASPASEPAPPPEPDRPEPPPPLSQPEPFVLVSLGAQLSSGFAPKLELGPAVAIALSPIRYLRVGISGSYFFARQYGASPGLELGHGGLGLLTCGMPLIGSFALGLCASGTVHRWSSLGMLLPHPHSETTYTWSAGLAARAEWRLIKRLWWVGSLGGELATVPLFFYFRPAAGHQVELFRQQRIAPTLFLGLTLELG
jgi:hypothetical protein